MPVCVCVSYKCNGQFELVLFLCHGTTRCANSYLSHNGNEAALPVSLLAATVSIIPIRINQRQRSKQPVLSQLALFVSSFLDKATVEAHSTSTCFSLFLPIYGLIEKVGSTAGRRSACDAAAIARVPFSAAAASAVVAAAAAGVGFAVAAAFAFCSFLI